MKHLKSKMEIEISDKRFEAPEIPSISKLAYLINLSALRGAYYRGVLKPKKRNKSS